MGCGVNVIVEGTSQGINLGALNHILMKLTQHRGQDSCGKVAMSATDCRVCKGYGLVDSVFAKERPEEQEINSVKNPIMIGGHVRYTTAGEFDLNSSQPHFLKLASGYMVLFGNGDMKKDEYWRVRHQLASQGAHFDSENDAELIQVFLAHYSDGQPRRILEAIKKLMTEVKFAFSGVLMLKDRMYVFRDPWGFRPLCHGTLDGALIYTSESCALDVVGADFVNEVLPGQVIIVTPTGGIEPIQLVTAEHLAMCIFEWIYYQRPDSIFNGVEADSYRQRLGELLAENYPVPSVDFVSSIPDSGNPATTGYARASGLVRADLFVHNRYAGRDFLRPLGIRKKEAGYKYNPKRGVIERSGTRLIGIDDSIIKGISCRALAIKARRVGAREIHLGITSPPYVNTCEMGIETKNRGELAAVPFLDGKGWVDEAAMAHDLGWDSLTYMRLEDNLKAFESFTDDQGQRLVTPENLCTHCFSGKSPFCKVCPCS